MYDINKVSQQNKIHLILEMGESPETFYLVSEAFYNQEQCFSDQCTIESCFTNMTRQHQKFEDDLYLEAFKKGYDTIVQYNGRTYEFIFESAESLHEVYDKDNEERTIVPSEIVKVLNNTWKYFEIVRII